MHKTPRLAAFFAVLLIVSGIMSVQAEPLSAPVRITIAHTNDMHARAVASKTEIGYDRIAGYVKLLKQENPNTLLLDVGDTLHGLPFANLEQGASIVRLLDAAGYSYMTTGNHDFNYGTPRLLQLEKQMQKTRILAANVYRDGKRVFTPYAIDVVGGVRVAIFGLASPETSYKSDPKGLDGVVFTNPVTEAQAIAYELAGKYDVLICLSHVGIDASSDPVSTDIAKAVPHIDVILDGHSHSSLKAEMELNKTNTLIASADSYGQSLGIVELVVGTDRAVTSKSARTVTLVNTPTMPSDPAVLAIIKDTAKLQDPILAEVVGKTAISLEGKREIVRTQQSNLGTLIANGMLYATGADVALMNGGGIRDSIPAGPLTKKQIFTVLPFGNYIQTTRVKGSEFDAILENGVGKLPAPDGRMPHLAGLTYTLDVTKPAGDRVSSIMIAGQSVNPDKEYVFATLNFLFNGGDGYTMLAGKKLNDFPSDAEVFLAYAKYLGEVRSDNLVYAR